MAFARDDDVVVHDNAQRLGDLDNGVCHGDIGARGRGVAGWVIVDLSSDSA